MKNFRLFIESTRSEVDPYGEEQWDNEGFYILQSIIYQDHFIFNVTEGNIEKFDDPFVYYNMIKDGELKKVNAYKYIIVDNVEKMDEIYNFGETISLSDNVLIPRQHRWYSDNRALFIDKKLMEKEQFIQICNELYDKNLEKFVPIVQKNIEELKAKVEDLINSEKYIKREI
jgi:hypothetical protein